MKYSFLLFVRNLKRQKLFSTINLLGLTVSIVGTLLIYLYVRFELSYDTFHNHAERVYRVNQTFIWGERNEHQFASTGPGVAHAIKEELPEVELITSIHTPGNFLVSYTNAKNEVIAFEQENVLASVEEKGKLIATLLVHPKIKEIRRIGLLFAIDFETAEEVNRIVEYAKQKGVICYWFLSHPNSFRIAPPLIISEQEIRDACAIIMEAIEKT